MDTFPLLRTIDSPADLRRLPGERLRPLADELRAYILHSVARTGGHLGSNLGTVELAIALHYVFDTPADRIVWDVGHQAYAHKVLTGRRDRMASLRQHGGLSGFPVRGESEYDAFGTAHSSTSISAALGMAVAARHKGERRAVVAVIGDGAMSAGMAFEALNNAGTAGCDLLVVLNDNDMSISPPVGALSRHLAGLARGGGGKGAPPLFQGLGFACEGPVDGHDIDALVAALRGAHARGGPRLLHVVTRKGRGYARAESDPIAYHGPAPFDPAAGIRPPAVAPRPAFTQVFGRWLCDMAERDERLVAVTPAMREGSGLVEFAARFPERYFDVGIAEQHAVTFAAGMACEGLKPVVAIYSTFLQRAYDQLVHDVALQRLPVVFALDRSGVVGADGPTHIGAYDIAYLRCIPDMSLACPADEDECRRLLSTAYAQAHPVAVRYPRGSGVGAAQRPGLDMLPFGKGEVRRLRAERPGLRGAHGVAVLAFGPLLYPALQAAQRLDLTVVNMRWAKPLDLPLLLEVAASHEALVTVEEGVTMGGAGSAVAEALHAAGVAMPLLQLGLPDETIPHGDPGRLLAACGLDAAGIEAAVRRRLRVALRHAA